MGQFLLVVLAGLFLQLLLLLLDFVMAMPVKSAVIALTLVVGAVVVLALRLLLFGYKPEVGAEAAACGG